MEPTSPQPDNSQTEARSSDVNEQRAFAILGYILPFLFFLPLLNEKTKDAPFARFHANQQLLLLISTFLVYSLQNVLMMGAIGLVVLLVQAANFLLIGLAIYGAYHAYKGEQKELPLIGQFKIL